MIADIDRPVDLARLFMEHGMSLRRAHTTLQRIVRGESVAVQVSNGDPDALAQRLSAFGIEALELKIPDVSTRAIRARLNLSQSDFALTFGFELDTVQNWDQGRTQPDAATKLLLAIIDRDPSVVQAVLTGHRGPAVKSN